MITLDVFFFNIKLTLIHNEILMKCSYVQNIPSVCTSIYFWHTRNINQISNALFLDLILSSTSAAKQLIGQQVPLKNKKRMSYCYDVLVR